MIMAQKPQRSDRYTFMTQTPIPRLIVSLSVPTIISMLVTGIYNTVDTYFVGQIQDAATQATAAVGVVFPLMAVIQAFGFFFGHGSGNYLSRMLGAGNKKEADEMAATGFFAALIFGVALALFCNLLIDPLVSLLASGEVSAETHAMAAKYARVILIGAPFMMAQCVINNQLRFQGSAVYAMFGLVSGAVLNMALDPLLIFVFNMGVTGAALATVISQFAGFIILFIGSRRGENVRASLKNVRFNAHYLLQIVNGGSPSLFRQGLNAVATTLLNRTAGQFGADAAVAGMSVVTRIMMLLASALIGFGQGYQPVCSYNYGANLKNRVREGFFFCVKWGTAFLLIVAALCFAFAPQVVAFFRDDPDVVKVGTAALRFQTCVLPLHAFIVMTNMMLQSMGKGVKASITASARNGLFFIPAILILPLFFGLTGVEAAQAVADVCSLILTIPLAAIELNKMHNAQCTMHNGG